MNIRSRRKLVRDLGGHAELARQITQRTGKAITRQSIESWIVRGFPPARVEVLSEISGRAPADLLTKRQMAAAKGTYGWLDRQGA